ncbi:Xaa-Pro aminopeptidase [Cohaesibacter marisflavi]|uniref:Xaa-Pro aminopeptidase n=1 Tax=Cohaesibacter marisflavi TaxID=655353 RepID=A0A1I5CFE3_9HYPH|nr:Xaa-Pro peptidase family protein [Cohaesibacter marisflavi]SFN85755.1 Xaa-Pro aminopeptidase [Cohaesibacter marisflavi]
MEQILMNDSKKILFENRLSRLRARMAEIGTDLVAVGPTSNMAWLAGVSAHGDERPVMVLVTQKDAAFLMPALNQDSVRQHTDLPFYCWTDADGATGTLNKMLADFGLARQGVSVAVDEAMRADFALLLLDALPDNKRQFLGDTLGYLRCRKDETEYAQLKENAVLTDACVTAAFDHLQVGMTELDVIKFIDDYFASHGATTEFASVCFGGNGAFPHHDSGETKLQEGMPLMIDLGCRKGGYPSDMTRSGYFGAKPEGYEEIAVVVEAAVKAALAAAKPGVKASAIDDAARSTIAKAGYGEKFLHRTGHGLGIDVHEHPYMSASSETILEEGMVFSIEPGIYLAGQFGVRLEDIVIMRKDGPEILSDKTRDLIAAK